MDMGRGGAITNKLLREENAFTIAKVLIALVILAAIVWFVSTLFGPVAPKGPKPPATVLIIPDIPASSAGGAGAARVDVWGRFTTVPSVAGKTFTRVIFNLFFVPTGADPATAQRTPASGMTVSFTLVGKITAANPAMLKITTNAAGDAITSIRANGKSLEARVIAEVTIAGKKGSEKSDKFETDPQATSY